MDIAGFTVTTSRQSRQENADLIHTFGRVLLPIIKGYKGRLIKSIGDAYLITFRSPTDAMLCSMALQDAMHGNNLNLLDEEKIHIRVAAHLGEVRVAKKDIFGEPVNVASRIEGVTPGDEIYLSEAVYMAMNKAEVPVEEVGSKQLAGVSQSVRLYCIPRFSTHRLVPEKRGEPEVGNELVYPYGGMHYQASNEAGFAIDFSRHKHKLKLFFIALAVFVSLVFLTWYFQSVEFSVFNKQNELAVVEPKGALQADIQQSPFDSEGSEINQAAKDLAAVNQQGENNPALAASEELVIEPVKAAANVELIKPSVLKKQVQSPPLQVWNVRKAKQAYRDSSLSKVEYSKVISDLKAVYNKRIAELKLSYRADQITKVEYKEAVRKAKKEYEGD